MPPPQTATLPALSLAFRGPDGEFPGPVSAFFSQVARAIERSFRFSRIRKSPAQRVLRIAGMSTEAFGQAFVVKQRGSFENGARNFVKFFDKAETQHPHRKTAVLDWPYRPSVIAIRIVC